MGTTLHSMGRIADFLGLPDTCLPVTTIVAGYPAEDPSRRDRLPFRSMIHDEIYHDPTDDEIDEIFREREVRGWERYMSIPEVKQRIDEMGILNLAHYYTSPIKYDPDEFREDSEKLRALLESKHFLP